jgi:hypothetical protein
MLVMLGVAGEVMISPWFRRAPKADALPGTANRLTMERCSVLREFI